jgi:ribosomal subunit interface protein
MEITVKGKQIDLGDAFRGHADTILGQLVEKYFDRAIDAAVIISKDAHLVKADISVHPISGLTLQSAASGNDPYAALDGAAEKIAKQLRRYKRRLTAHAKPKLEAEDAILAQQFIIKPEPVDTELPAEENAPVIVAEMAHDVPDCTVSGAVMRLDLSDTNAILFRNSSHGRLNMVYRRQDGNIGWVDPEATNGKG